MFPGKFGFNPEIRSHVAISPSSTVARRQVQRVQALRKRTVERSARTVQYLLGEVGKFGVGFGFMWTSIPRAELLHEHVVFAPLRFDTHGRGLCSNCRPTGCAKGRNRPAGRIARCRNSRRLLGDVRPRPKRQWPRIQRLSRSEPAGALTLTATDLRADQRIE